MKITAKTLREKKAGEDKVLIFEKEWGIEVEVTLPNLLRAVELQLDIDWFACHCLPVPIWARYYAEAAPILARYDAEEAPILARHNVEIASIWARYNVEIAPIRARYDAEKVHLIDRLLNE